MLFILKLYIGLSSNSISIYSDGINNLFDSLIGLVSFLFLNTLLKRNNVFNHGIYIKTEQLLTFLISVTVFASGLYFAYNSLERLMYPTPIWYKEKYLYLISLTAIIKLGLFLLLRSCSGKKLSSVINVMATDSLLDFFITLVTVVSLLVSKNGTYAVDAFCGIGISGIIIFTAVKNVLSALKRLAGSPSKENKAKLEAIFMNEDIIDVSFNFSDTTQEMYIKVKECEPNKVKALAENIEAQTGIKAYFIICEKNILV